MSTGQPGVSVASPRRRMSAHSMLQIALVLLAAPTFLAWLARWHWTLDLLTHFPAQSAVLMVLFVGAFAALRNARWACAAAVVLAVNLARLAPLYWPTSAASEVDGPIWKLISANVHTGNRDTAALLDLVRREDPDFVLAIEVDNRWIRALASLKDRYPHFLEQPRSDNFGIAFYSKHALDSLETIELADSEVPTVVARLTRDDRPLTLYGVHTLPPIGRTYTGLRDRHLDALAARIAGDTPSPIGNQPDGTNASGGDVVVAGDLNITSWSPTFARFARTSDLRDTRQGRGIQPTWPTRSPLIRIPIDHVLVSDVVVVRSRRVGPTIGSDHFPVIVEFGRKRR